ncbi:hypothetical protein EZS27_025784, partial [termite gut metagenome]
PLIQHKLSDMISSMGVTVVTEDMVRGEDVGNTAKTFLVSQWAPTCFSYIQISRI